MFISWVIVVSVTTLRAVHSILPPLWTAAITNPATITASCSSFNYLSVGGVRAVGANPEQDPLHHPGPGGHTLGLVASPDRGSSRQFLREKFSSHSCSRHTNQTHYTAEKNFHNWRFIADSSQPIRRIAQTKVGHMWSHNQLSSCQ